jgi:hypothetical protein
VPKRNILQTKRNSWLPWSLSRVTKERRSSWIMSNKTALSVSSWSTTTKLSSWKKCQWNFSGESKDCAKLEYNSIKNRRSLWNKTTLQKRWYRCLEDKERYTSVVMRMMIDYCDFMIDYCDFM